MDESNTERREFTCAAGNGSNNSSPADLPRLDDELFPQCEILPQGAKGAKKLFDRCTLNPGHTQFMTWPQFQEASLPECVTEENKIYLKNIFDRTVRITVSYTSENRPDKFSNSDMPYPYVLLRGDNTTQRCGTGLLDFNFTTEFLGNGPANVKCPCPECKKSGQPKIGYWQMKVLTASHVIYDSKEAASSVFTLFHDSEKDADVKHLYGRRVFSLGGSKFDKTSVDYVETVCVTHDPDLGQRVMKLVEDSRALYRRPRLWDSLGFIISHPHGVCKRISFGTIHECCFVMSSYDENSEVKLRKGCCVSWAKDDDSRNTQLPCQSPSTDVKEEMSLYLSKGRDEESQECVKTKNGRSFEHVSLPFDSVIKIPDTAKYWYKHEFRDSSRFIFPIGTQLLSPDGTPLPLPTDLEISFPHEGENLVYDERNVGFLHFYTYNIATCPGSSGALLIRSNDCDRVIPHFGRRANQNLSGLGRIPR